MNDAKNARELTTASIMDPKLIHERLGIPFSSDWNRDLPLVIEDVAEAERLNFGSKTEVIDYLLGYLDKQRHKLHHKAKILQSRFIENRNGVAHEIDILENGDCNEFMDSEVKVVTRNNTDTFQLCDFASSLHDPNLTNIETLHQLNLNKLRELETRIRGHTSFNFNEVFPGRDAMSNTVNLNKSTVTFKRGESQALTHDESLQNTNFKEKLANYVLQKETNDLQKRRRDLNRQSKENENPLTHKAYLFYNELVDSLIDNHSIQEIKKALFKLNIPENQSVFNKKEIENIVAQLQNQSTKQLIKQRSISVAEKNQNLLELNGLNCDAVEDQRLMVVSEELMEDLGVIFKELDEKGILVVRLKSFIDRIRSNSNLALKLSQPVLYFTKFDKSISLDRYLQFLETNFVMEIESENSGSEYISWQQFLEKLLAYEHFSTVPYLPLKKNVYGNFRITLNESVRDHILKLFHQMKNSHNLVSKEKFVQNLLDLPVVEQNTHQIVRKNMNSFSISPFSSSETLEQRIKALSDSQEAYLDLKEIFDILLFDIHETHDYENANTSLVKKDFFENKDIATGLNNLRKQNPINAKEDNNLNGTKKSSAFIPKNRSHHLGTNQNFNVLEEQAVSIPSRLDALRPSFKNEVKNNQSEKSLERKRPISNVASENGARYRTEHRQENANENHPISQTPNYVKNSVRPSSQQIVNGQSFKAKEIPWFCTKNIFKDQVETQEQKRKERILSRAMKV